MINIQFDPKGKEKAVQAAKKGWAYGKQGGLWLWHAVRKLKPSRALLMKSGAVREVAEAFHKKFPGKKP